MQEKQSFQRIRKGESTGNQWLLSNVDKYIPTAQNWISITCPNAVVIKNGCYEIYGFFVINLGVLQAYHPTSGSYSTPLSEQLHFLLK